MRLLFVACGAMIVNCDSSDDSVGSTDDGNGDEGTALIQESMFNTASLVSFQSITSTLEDGTTAACYEITFSSNPVASGPFCPATINDVAGMGFYDGASNPGLRVFSAALLNDIEADGIIW
nr:hypothetical protein [Nonlabens ulvanivorans]